MAFKNLLHQMYAMDGSRKVKAAKRTRNGRGEYTSGLAPYGYRKDPEDIHKLVIDQEEAGVVREIFSLAEEGYSFARIARILNDRGEPTPYDKKCGYFRNHRKTNPRYSDYHVWGMPAVREIIKNASYKGQMVQNRYENVGYGDAKKCVPADRNTWSVVDGAVPAIVDTETFDRVNRLKSAKSHASGRRSAAKEKNLFVCAHCGRKLMKTSPNGRYVCPVRRVKSHTACGQVDLKVSAARDMALATVKELALIIIRNKDYYDMQEKKRIRDIDAGMRACEEEKARLEKCILSSYGEYASGTVSREEYIVSRKACRKSIDRVESETGRLWDELHRAVRVDDGAMIRCRALQEFDPDLLSEAVECVRIYDDRKIEVVFGADDVFARELPEDAAGHDG